MNGGRTVVDEDAVVAKETRVLQRRHDAAVEVGAHEQECRDTHVTQDAVQVRLPEAAEANLGDVDVAVFDRQLVDYRRPPTAEFENPVSLGRTTSTFLPQHSINCPD